MNARTGFRSVAGACLAVLALALTACAPRDSAFVPASPEAREVGDLFWGMAGAAFLIWLAMLGLAYYAVRARGSVALAHRWIWIGGLVVAPVATVVLLSFGLRLMPVRTAQASQDLRIIVTGEQYWWRVRYERSDGTTVVTANEIALPADRRTELILRSEDVIHSFWIPPLGGKLDMIPGRENRLVLEPTRVGSYRGRCAELCGQSHAFMRFDVEVLEAPAFDAWFFARGGDARAPVTDQERRGQQLFVENGCPACHRIAGSTSQGVLGPDLTHYASRRTLGAGRLPNNVGTTAGWIADAQHLKPGNGMPSFGRVLQGPELRAIAAYLGSLR